MHRGWITAATAITVLLTDGAAMARDRSLPQADPPPLPYRLDDITNAPPLGRTAPRAPASATAPAAHTARASATGSVRGGYYYPPAVTVTTVIEYQRP